MNKTLSQEEIDRLMNQASESDHTKTAELEEEISQMERDIIGDSLLSI